MPRWFLPLVILCLLLLAFVFRWQEGPKFRSEDSIRFHQRDRWTGQGWEVLQWPGGENREARGVETPPSDWELSGRTICFLRPEQQECPCGPDCENTPEKIARRAAEAAREAARWAANPGRTAEDNLNTEDNATSIWVVLVIATSMWLLFHLGARKLVKIILFVILGYALSALYAGRLSL